MKNMDWGEIAFVIGVGLLFLACGFFGGIEYQRMDEINRALEGSPYPVYHEGYQDGMADALENQELLKDQFLEERYNLVQFKIIDGEYVEIRNYSAYGESYYVKGWTDRGWIDGG